MCEQHQMYEEMVFLLGMCISKHIHLQVVIIELVYVIRCSYRKETFT